MAGRFTPEEKDQLVTAFEALDVKPKLDDPASLQQWMADYLKGVGRVGVHNPDDAAAHPSRSTHLVHTPRIACFSGDEEKDSSFEAWKFEVMTLVKEGTYSDKVITSALMKSLRGDAAKVVRRLGLNASIEDILNKFEGIFGTVEDSENLLSNFYSAEQLPNEKVSTWGCRLEDLLDRALQGQPISSKSVDDMLKMKFWSGLRDHIKEATRHLRNSVKDFDQLRVEARKVEHEHSGSFHENPRLNKSAHLKAMKAKSGESDVDKMKGDIRDMNTKIGELHSLMMTHLSSKPHPNSNQLPPPSSPSPPREIWNTNQNQHRGSWTPQQNPSRDRWSSHQGQPRDSWPSHSGQSRGSWTNNNNHRGRGRHRGGSSRVNTWTPGQQVTTNDQQMTNHFQRHLAQDQGSSRQHGEIICHRCKRPGHVAIGCRADLSHLHLNVDESV
jgi:hypothetical protein